MSGLHVRAALAEAARARPPLVIRQPTDPLSGAVTPEHAVVQAHRGLDALTPVAAGRPHAAC